MPYQQAQCKFYSRFSLGAVLFLIAFFSTLSSLLKMFYFGSHANTPLANALMHFLQNAVDSSQQNTYCLRYLWTHLPLPTLKVFWAKQNLYFLASYVCIFISLAYISSALALRKRLRIVDQKVKYALSIDSAVGRNIRSKDEIQKAIPIPTPKFYPQFRTLLLAPVLVAALIILFTKYAGLI